jgi:tetratricopeptide (TPR) repeat protein
MNSFLPRPLLTAGLLALSAPLWAGAETVLGVSNAQRCFEGALAGQSSLSTIELCTKALEIENLSEKDRAATYTNRGILYGQSGRAERALGDFGRALELSPGLIHALINRGNLFVRLKRFTEAMADYDQALFYSEGRNALVYFNRSLAQEQLGRKKAAQEDLLKAVQLEPENIRFREALAAFK